MVEMLVVGPPGAKENAEATRQSAVHCKRSSCGDFFSENGDSRLRTVRGEWKKSYDRWTDVAAREHERLDDRTTSQ
jgi:hypothetical protein